MRSTLKHPNASPGRARREILAQAYLDVDLAVLLVASVLEREGREHDAAALRLELGTLRLRAALHEHEHPGPMALGHEMARIVAAVGAPVRVGQGENRVNPRVQKKPTKKARR